MRKSKSALFLMELIIVIFFFALTSAVCLSVFVKAHDISRSTESLNYAFLWADNASELFNEYSDDSKSVSDTLLAEFAKMGAYDGKYRIDLSFSDDESFRYMRYCFVYVPDDKTVYDFTFKQHIKEVSK